MVIVSRVTGEKQQRSTADVLSGIPGLLEEVQRELYEDAKAAAPSTLLTYVNFPPTEFLELDCFDLFAFNVYLHREPELRAYLSRLQHIAGTKPMLLAEAGAELLLPTLEGLSSGSLRPRPQDHRLATLAPKVTKEIAFVRWDQVALKIHNQIRALNPWPLARTEFRGQSVQLFHSLPARVVESRAHAPGTLAGLTEGGILVQCGEETVLEILQLQVAGRKRVTGRQFAAGARVSPGESLFPVTTTE